ncbi:MAG: hypothetical protein QOG69_273 [Actinomycetota bacterium]|jgi:hypothetical protein|nr:hypothetical protein [Actinomycetota bacterium]
MALTLFTRAGDVDDLAKKGVQGVTLWWRVTPSVDCGLSPNWPRPGSSSRRPSAPVALEEAPAQLNTSGNGFAGKTIVIPEQP